MITTVLRPTHRSLAIVLTAVVLAASFAFVAASEIQAAKPTPVVGFNGATCSEVLGESRYSAFFDLGDNKGRWVQVEVDLNLGGAGWVSQLSGRVETEVLNVSATGPVPHQDSSWRLTFVNKKGVVLAPPTVVDARACSV